VRFDAVAALFAGWDGGPTDRHAWLAGEPVGACWTRGGEEVRYSANPAIGLRVLSGSGAEGARGRLAVLSPTRARALASSEELGRALLGVTASGLYGDVRAVDRLTALTRDPRPELRAASELALRRVGVALFGLAADRIAARRRAAPGCDPVLGLLGPPATRRQLIRWVATEPPADRGRRLELVRAGLGDDDWEVRWSSVIAAFALRLHETALDVRRCRPADRAHRADRQILEALREVVGRHLTGSRSERPGAEHLLACLDGRARERDRAFMLITALRTPLPVSPVPAAPRGFCSVPAVLHWLGDPEQPADPLRAVVPAGALAIAEDALDDIAVADVPGVLRALEAEHRLELRLPTPHELQMAARGPDGRGHPWGNGRERDADAARSPWGLARPLTGPEWVQHGGEPMALGGAGRCAGPPHRAVTAGLRQVVAAPGDGNRDPVRESAETA
jgi:hypothetical protein